MSASVMSGCHCPVCGAALPDDPSLKVDEPTGIVIRNGRFAHLPPSEMAIFAALTARPGHVRSKEALLNALGRLEMDEPEIKIVDVLVCKVRRKLQPLGITIKTAWGDGYLYVPEAAR